MKMAGFAFIVKISLRGWERFFNVRREDYSHIRLRAIFVFNNSLSRKNSRLYGVNLYHWVGIYNLCTEYRQIDNFFVGVWVRGKKWRGDSI